MWDVLVAGTASTPMVLSLSGSPHPAAGIVLTILGFGALLVRRLQPARRVAALVAGALLLLCVVDLALDTDLGIEITVFVAIYTLAVTGATWLTVTAGIAMVTLAAVGAAQVSDSLLVLSLFAALVAAAAGTGLYRSARRDVIRQWHERVESLRREKDAVEELAATTERLRIAREMHDVVGHHLTVMVTLAQAAATAVPPDGDAAQALGMITETGRDALTETRRMLGVLRTPRGAAPDAPTDPLALTLAAVNAAGLIVSLSGRAEWDRLPVDLSEVLHRVLQETLTNALKYAGPGAAVHIVIVADGGDLRLTVTDDGAGVPAPGTSTSGLGMAGIHERLAPFGGSVDAGPAGTGWQVVVTVPHPPAGATDLLATPTLDTARSSR